MDKIKCIYAIKDKRNDKVIYIGQTKDFNQRKRQHFGHKKQPIDNYMFVNKRNNFEMFILEKLNENILIQEIKRKEQDYINKYDTIINGLNLLKSGNCPNIKFYYETNKKILLEKKKNYYQENKEELSNKNKNYRKENKELLSEYNKKYYQENKEEILAKRKDKYYSNHEESLDYYRERRKIKKLINATIYNS